MQNLFPPKPLHVPAGITMPSAAFKKEIVKVFTLCILFFLLYLLLLTAMIGIAFLAGYLGILLVSAIRGFIPLMLAIGAIGMGVMLIYFMLKALMLKEADPIATVAEVTEESDPHFFSFIKKVCEETQAPFPKRIFLVDDVNAFVSFDSLFLSLFLPARKNLYIGLGLINMCTVSELKAIIAHEFGHFSQGSMRFGSYVYHVNQIIYKMVADNAGYNASLEKWANYSSYFALFARINISLIQLVQRIMKSFYKVLNKGYRGLARQMEFQADAVAASVAGSLPLISSLYRMDLATTSYSHTLDFYNNLVKNNLKADNLFAHHLKSMQMLALREDVQLKGGFPMVDAQTINRLGGSRIVVKDQWASHPSVEDREAALLKLNVLSETIDESSWKLFTDPVKVQTAQTDRLYQNVTFSDEPALLNVDEFEKRFSEQLLVNNFQPEYKNYYNDRDILPFELDLPDYAPEDIATADLFSEEYLQLPKQLNQIGQDIAILDAIAAEESDYESFDFDGQRYPVGDAYSVKAHLEAERVVVREKINRHDQDIYYTAYRKAKLNNTEKDLIIAYQTMFDQGAATDKDIALYNEMANQVAPAYSQLPLDEIKQLVLKIIDKETILKERLAEVLTNTGITNIDAIKDDLEQLQSLVDSRHVYFTQNNYLNEQLDLLNTACNAFLNVISHYNFKVKKNALEIQLRHLNVGVLTMDNRSL